MEHVLEDGRADGACHVIAAFRPVETPAREDPACTPKLSHIDAPLAQEHLAVFCNSVFPLCRGENQRAPLEKVSESHTEFPSEVVITASRVADRLALANRFALSRTRDHPECLDSMGHLGRRNPVIAMPPLRCNLNQTALKQLGQVHAGRLC